MSNFENLSDHDFEFLVADLFRAEFGGRYEVFPRGADGGIDVRKTRPMHGPVIVQCKHMLKSSFSQLKRSAKAEVFNLEKMDPKPSEYFFVTSQSLTDALKQQLIDVLRPWITQPDHILGELDIKQLISNHPSVERAHVKLYIASGGHLDRVFNSSTYEQSAQLRSEIRTALPKYVETGAYNQARRRLADQKALVISGPPGIGKTTLAQLLVADAMSEGYEPIQISRDIDEAWKIVNDRDKRIFYYDDFLGATFLESRLDKNEDRRITSFLQRCSSSTNNLFILTTREHLFSQASEWYETIRGSGLEENKLILQLRNYTSYEKAKILYNHLYSLDKKLLKQVRSALSDWTTVRRIIEHQNYTPRSIAAIAGSLEKEQPASFVTHAIKVLDTPSLIWEQAFNREIDSSGQDLVIALATNAFQSLDQLERRFQGFAKARGNDFSKRAYGDAVRRVEGSFVRSDSWAGNPQLRVMNPSVTDFVTGWLRQNEAATLALLKSCSSYKELQFIFDEIVSDFSRSGKIAKAVAKAASRVIDVDDSGRRGVPHPGQMLFLIEAAEALPGVRDKLDGLLVRGLSTAVKSWPTSSVIPAQEMVRLAIRLEQLGRLEDSLLLAIEACLVWNNDKYSWPQTVVLDRHFAPRLANDLEQLSEAFREWAEAEADQDGFADEDEIAEARGLGTYFGVDEYDDVWDIATNGLKERRAHEPADSYEGPTTGFGRSAAESDDSSLILAMLGRLGNQG
jgi:DNA polymerase III delta prime subunit